MPRSKLKSKLKSNQSSTPSADPASSSNSALTSLASIEAALASEPDALTVDLSNDPIALATDANVRMLEAKAAEDDRRRIEEEEKEGDEQELQFETAISETDTNMTTVSMAPSTVSERVMTDIPELSQWTVTAESSPTLDGTESSPSTPLVMDTHSNDADDEYTSHVDTSQDDRSPMARHSLSQVQHGSPIGSSVASSPSKTANDGAVSAVAGNRRVSVSEEDDEKVLSAAPIMRHSKKGQTTAMSQVDHNPDESEMNEATTKRKTRARRKQAAEETLEDDITASHSAKQPDLLLDDSPLTVGFGLISQDNAAVNDTIQAVADQNSSRDRSGIEVKSKRRKAIEQKEQEQKQDPFSFDLPPVAESSSHVAMFRPEPPSRFNAPVERTFGTKATRAAAKRNEQKKNAEEKETNKNKKKKAKDHEDDAVEPQNEAELPTDNGLDLDSTHDPAVETVVDEVKASTDAPSRVPSPPVSSLLSHQVRSKRRKPTVPPVEATNPPLSAYAEFDTLTPGQVEPEGKENESEERSNHVEPDDSVVEEEVTPSTKSRGSKKSTAQAASGKSMGRGKGRGKNQPNKNDGDKCIPPKRKSSRSSADKTAEENHETVEEQKDHRVDTDAVTAEEGVSNALDRAASPSTKKTPTSSQPIDDATGLSVSSLHGDIRRKRRRPSEGEKLQKESERIERQESEAMDRQAKRTKRSKASSDDPFNPKDQVAAEVEAEETASVVETLHKSKPKPVRPLSAIEKKPLVSMELSPDEVITQHEEVNEEKESVNEPPTLEMKSITHRGTNADDRQESTKKPTESVKKKLSKEKKERLAEAMALLGEVATFSSDSDSDAELEGGNDRSHTLPPELEPATPIEKELKQKSRAKTIRPPAKSKVERRQPRSHTKMPQPKQAASRGSTKRRRSPSSAVERYDDFDTQLNEWMSEHGLTDMEEDEEVHQFSMPNLTSDLEEDHDIEETEDEFTDSDATIDVQSAIGSGMPKGSSLVDWMSSLAEQVSAAEQARLNKFQHSKEQLIEELLSMNKQMAQVISKKRKEIKGSMRSRESAGTQEMVKSLQQVLKHIQSSNLPVFQRIKGHIDLIRSTVLAEHDIPHYDNIMNDVNESCESLRSELLSVVHRSIRKMIQRVQENNHPSNIQNIGRSRGLQSQSKRPAKRRSHRGAQ